MSPSKDPGVLYVLGYGHSGSTVLNIALGQHPDLFGAGELCLLSRAWRNGEYCSCGTVIAECPTWGAVVEAWRARSAGDPIAVQSSIQRAVERAGLPFGPRRNASGGLFGDYAALMRDLVASVREVTGKRWVVDSSKRAGRAWALAQVPGLDVRAVHLVRDGRGVAWSLLRSLEKNAASGVQRAKRPKPAARTSLAWAGANVAAEAVRRRLGGGRSVRLRYEDFVNDPGEALGAIGTITGVDFAEVAHGLRAGLALDPGHVVAGNRVRMAGPLVLRYDREWRARLPAVQRRVAGLMCWPLLRHYGYD